MKVLVTGGAGFIGSHVAEAFLAEGAAVTVLDDLSHGRREYVPDGAQFVHEKVETPAAAELIRSGDFDVVAHLAAQVDVRTSFDAPERDATVNIMGTLNVLQAMKTGARILFASSASVYGDVKGYPTLESAPKAPLAPYGIGKLTGEMYIRVMGEHRGLQTTVFRFGNVFGARQDPMGDGGVIAIFIGKLMRGEPLPVFGDGLHLRDYIHVEDIAGAFTAATRDQADGTFNLGLGQGTTTLDIASALRGAFGSDAAPIEHVAERPGDIRNSVLCPDRFLEATSWSPTRDLKPLLERVVTWYQGRSSEP